MNVAAVNNFYGRGGADSALSPSGGISTGGILDLLVKILEKENDKVNGTLQQAENAGGLQQGGAGDIDGTGGHSQNNIEMLKAQQAMTEMNTVNTAATNMIQSVGDAQKSVAQNTK